MRVIVTGSRDWRDMPSIYDALMALPEQPATIVQGCASGADAIARAIAAAHDWPVEDFWPDYWHFTFADANKRRNQAMVDSGADLVLAFPTKNSRGTWHCMTRAKAAGIEVKVFEEAS